MAIFLAYTSWQTFSQIKNKHFEPEIENDIFDLVVEYFMG